MNSTQRKAIELENKFYLAIMKKNYPNVAQRDVAKVCALIAIAEILNIGWNLPHYENKSGEQYWQEVKQEIEKL